MELLTGASWRTMQLELFSDDGKFIKSLSSDSATLSSSDIKDGMRIHVSVCVYTLCCNGVSFFSCKVTDIDPLKKKGEFEDVSQVEKYEMSEEEYSKRTGK